MFWVRILASKQHKRWDPNLWRQETPGPPKKCWTPREIFTATHTRRETKLRSPKQW